LLFNEYVLIVCVYRGKPVQSRAQNWRRHIKKTHMVQLSWPLTLPSMRLASKVCFIFIHTHTHTHTHLFF